MAESHIAQDVDEEEDVDLEHDLPADLESQLREAFNIFDQDNSGNIDATEMKQIMEAVSPHENFSVEEINQMIKTVDHDDSGEINMQEFLKLISNHLKDDGPDDEPMI